MKRKDAERLRAHITRAAETLPDETALEVTDIFPRWVTDKAYTVGDRVQYGGELYRCLQAHTSQADWTPGAAVSLWGPVRIGIPEWVQPTGATDAYSAGDKVTHNGKTWTSDVDNNVWEPGVYGWTEEGGTT